MSEMMKAPGKLGLYDPAHEHEAFIGHFRGLVGLWVTDTKAALQPTGGQPA